jgi:RHS repeat-associated protein
MGSVIRQPHLIAVEELQIFHYWQMVTDASVARSSISISGGSMRITLAAVTARFHPLGTHHATVLLRAASIVLFFGFFLGGSPQALAQITNVTGDQAPPIPGAGHDYIHMLNETVNPGSGAVSIRIAVPIAPGRGLSMPFGFGYDSGSAYHVDGTGTSSGWTDSRSYLSTGGWTYLVTRITASSEQYTYPENGGPPSICNRFTDYMMTDLQGSDHALGLSIVQPPNYGSCQVPGPWNVNTLSGQDATVQATTTTWTFPSGPDSAAPVTVADMDGTVYYFAQPAHYLSWNTASVSAIPTWIEDRNGNKITFTDLNNGDFSVTDTAGRTLISSSGFGTTGNTLTVSGLTNPYRLTWGSVSPTVYPLGATYSHQTNPPPSGSCSTFGTVSTENPEITAIELPNGQSYGFQYDAATGLLQKLTYPTGGYVRYVWAASPTSEILTYPDSKGVLDCQAEYATEKVAQRYVSFDGTHEVLQQNFTYSTAWPAPQSSGLILTWQTKTTTVTTYDLVRGTNFQTIYTYSPFAVPTPPNDPVVVGSAATPVETQVAYHDIGGGLLRTDVKTYYDPQLPPTETDTLGNSQTSETQYTYASLASCQTGTCLSRLTDKYDNDYGPGAPGALLKHTHFDYASFSLSPLFQSAVSILDRPSDVIICQAASCSSANEAAETDYVYGSAVSSASATGHDEVNYGPSETPPRGNATKVTKKCFPSCANVVTAYAYDETGQTTSMTDPNGNTTTYSHLDSYTIGTPPSNTDAYVTQIKRPTTTNGVSHISNYSYGYFDGQLTVANDENSQPTTYTYADSLDRLTAVNYPDNGQTTYSYNDAPPSPSVTTSKLITSGLPLTIITTLDGVGHQVGTALTSDRQGTIYTVNTLDGLGHTLTSSNPYRSTDPTYITTYAYDALGRTCLVAPPDGTVPTGPACPTSQPSNDVFTTYSGNQTTVTDQQGITRTSQTDSLGRLTNVWEAPSGVNFETIYTYDALDDLLTVVQGGSHNRSFAYDSLERLTSSKNPETGTTPVLYTYDANSNVVTKTDARGTIINYSPASNPIDQLNRVTSKTYSDGTPTVVYTYDGIAPSACSAGGFTYTNAIGRRSGMCDADGSEFWSYDPMGREKAEQRTTNSITKNTGYTYDLKGDLATLTYPSGRVMTYVTDSAARPSSAQDVPNNIFYMQGTCSNGINSLGVCYAPQGAIASANVGPTGGSTWLKAAMTYNDRLQPNQIQYSNQAGSLMSLQYSFLDASSHNNGNVMAVTNLVDGTRSQQFTYDQLNRLLTAETTSTYSTSPAHCWGEAYVYDNATTTPGEFGNLTNINVPSTAYNGCQMESSLSLVANSNNQISSFSYDTSGNILNDTHNSYTWNAESEIKTAAGVTYTYDGDGNRLQKSSGKIYWYGAGTEVLDESDSSGNITDEYVYFGGKRVAHRVVSGNSIYYYGEDFLGTSRQIFTSTSALCYDADFYPFGGERPYTDTCPPTYKFEGKERDSETENDHFPAREYSSRFGRWMRPDPLPWIDWQHGNKEDQEKFEDFLLNPQNLNMYTFVDNDPMSKTDPTGMQGCQAGDKQFTTCTITIVYDPKTSKGTITVTGQNKGDKDPTVLLTGSVVVGGDGHVTPTGTFTAQSWEKDHVSTKYGSWANTKWSDSAFGKNVFGPFQLHISELDNQGIMLHGTLGPSWSPTTWGNTVVGSTSHGCIRLCNQQDIALHNLMPNPRGNQIIIKTTGKPDDDNQ